MACDRFLAEGCFRVGYCRSEQDGQHGAPFLRAQKKERGSFYTAPLTYHTKRLTTPFRVALSTICTIVGTAFLTAATDAVAADIDGDEGCGTTPIAITYGVAEGIVASFATALEDQLGVNQGNRSFIALSPVSDAEGVAIRVAVIGQHIDRHAAADDHVGQIIHG